MSPGRGNVHFDETACGQNIQPTCKRFWRRGLRRASIPALSRLTRFSWAGMILVSSVKQYQRPMLDFISEPWHLLVLFLASYLNREQERIIEYLQVETTLTGTPTSSSSKKANGREMRSVPAPAPHGQMNVIGWFGNESL